MGGKKSPAAGEGAIRDNKELYLFNYTSLMKTFNCLHNIPLCLGSISNIVLLGDSCSKKAKKCPHWKMREGMKTTNQPNKTTP